MHTYLEKGAQSSFSALSVADIMLQLNVTDSTQNAYVTTLLNAAVGYIERRTALDLRTTTWTLVGDSFPYPPYWNWRGYGYFPIMIPNYPQYALGSEILYIQEINLKRGALQSVTSITYYDLTNTLQTLDPATYALKKPTYLPGAIQPMTYYPIAYPRPDAVAITYVAGLSTVPDDILHAIKLLCGSWYMAREDIAYGPNTVSGATGCAVDALLATYGSIQPC